MSRKWDRRITWAMTIVFLAIAIPWFVPLVPDAAGVVGPVLRYMIHTGLKETVRDGRPLRRRRDGRSGSRSASLITIRFKPLQWLIRGYIELWRGLPIVVTIFLIYFAFPRVDETFSLPFSINPLEAFLAATVGLILWGSAQVAEATRGAIQSIPREQHEAAQRARLRLDGDARLRDRARRRCAGCCRH